MFFLLLLEAVIPVVSHRKAFVFQVHEHILFQIGDEKMTYSCPL